MKTAPRSTAAGAGYYEVRVRGRLSESFLASFESLRATVAPLETMIHGTFRDRAELHALLQRIELFGLELIEVHASDAPPEPQHEDDLMAPAEAPHPGAVSR